MATIFNTLHKPNGQPIRDALVSVTLSWDTSLDVFVKNADNEVVVDNTAQIKTDVDGYWEMEVIPNDSLTPTCFYKVTETIDSTNINTYYIEVNDQATPLFWIGDLIVATPAWEA
jgi:hypothetical protein